MFDISDRHPDIQHMIKLFHYEHLPENLQQYSKPFCELAWAMVENTPDGLNLIDALRKLWESKNSYVMANLNG